MEYCVHNPDTNTLTKTMYSMNTMKLITPMLISIWKNLINLTNHRNMTWIPLRNHLKPTYAEQENSIIQSVGLCLHLVEISMKIPQQQTTMD